MIFVITLLHNSNAQFAFCLFFSLCIFTVIETIISRRRRRIEEEARFRDAMFHARFNDAMISFQESRLTHHKNILQSNRLKSHALTSIFKE